MTRMAFMNETPPQRGEVWRMAFAYEDNPDVFKIRPVVIADIDVKNGRVCVMAIQVTSHAPRPNYPGEVVIQDWKSAGLVKPSVARCTKRATVSIGSFRNSRKYGKLSFRDASAVDRALTELGVF